MKRYSEKIAQYALSGLLLLTALVAVCAPETAHAQPTNYAGERRQIRACVLVSSATSLNNPTPHVFYALDNRPDYRPAGWEFINPIAPNTITPKVYARWKARGAKDPAFPANNGSAQSQVFEIGAPLTKNIGAYWEVNLDTATDNTLSQFDVVLLPLQGGRNGGNVLFSVSERELLRHFVDQGGTLWVENEGVNGFNASVGQFITPLSPSNPVGNFQTISNPFHPLVNYPFKILPTDAQSLGTYTNLTGHLTFVDPTSGPVDPHNMVPIMTQANGANNVYAGDFGAGHIVITSSAVAADINGLIVGSLGTNGVTGATTTNDGVVSGSNFAAIPPIDLEFAYNLVGWVGGLPAAAANVRRTGSSLETVGYGLATKWSTYPKTPAAGNPGSGGIIFKNATFYVDGLDILHAYDVNPAESLSYDGLTADDGIADFITGAPYDEIWNYSFPQNDNVSANTVHYATPNIVSVNANGGLTDALIVSNTQGTTAVFRALPRDMFGRLSGAAQRLMTISLDKGDNPTVKGQGATPNNSQLQTPGAAYDDGVLFVPVYRVPTGSVTGGGWHVMAVDLLASLNNGGGVVNAFGTDQGVIPSIGTWNTTVEALGDITGSLSVGYVRDNSTGAIDEIVYVPVAGEPGVNPPVGPYIQGLWFRTRQEPLQLTTVGANTYWRPQGDRARIPWFTGNPPANGIDLRPVVHITHLDANGNILDVNDIPYSGGTLTLNYTTGIMQVSGFTVPAPIGNGDSYVVSADYAVDWPGLIVSPGSTALQGMDMTNMVTNRRYPLYVDGSQVVSPQRQPVPTGGAVIGSDDSALFAASSGLIDQVMQTNTTLPDRIYSVTEQFAGVSNNLTRGRATSTSVNWMFAPMYGGNFDGNAIRARLINSDNFRTNVQVSAGDAIPIGQVVQGGSGGVGGTALSGFQIVGQPVVSNGVVYVVANVQYNNAPFVTPSNSQPYNATVILALREKIDNTLNLETPVVMNIGSLILKQPNFSQQAAGAANYLTLHVVNDQGVGDFTADTVQDASGNTEVTALHLLNMQPRGTDTFNVAVPMYLTDGAAQQIPLVNANGYSKLDNLLWWITIPYSFPGQQASPKKNPILLQPELQYVGGNASSGPSVFGQTLYYNATFLSNGHLFGSIVTVDLKNAAKDNRLIDASTGSSRVHVLHTMTDPVTGNPFDLLAAGVNTPLINPPLATENTVVDGAAAGLAALDNQVTLIADNNRLIEVDAVGNAVWSMSATTSSTVVGNTLSSNSGGVASQNVSLARPTTARHFDANIYAVADTQNNRIVLVDRGGQVITEIHGLNNAMNFLKPGEPITLNQPSDVQIYVDQQTGGTISIPNRDTGTTYSYTGNYYAVHYIVADSGNFRALEIVSVYNPSTGTPITMAGTGGADAGNTVTMLQQVIFTTRSLGEQNLNYRYRTIQQFRDPTTIPPGGSPSSAAVVMIAAVENVKQAATGSSGAVNTAGLSGEAPGGSLMIINRFGAAGGFSTDGDVASIVNSISIPEANLSRVVRRQAISGPTFFREFDYVDPNVSLTTPIPRYLLCDANGCYVLAPRHVNADAANTIGPGPVNELVVDWMITDNDYYYLTGRHLRATSIQRLTQAELYQPATGNVAFAPHYLITNSYTGHDNIAEVFGSVANPLTNVIDGDIHGEVFEVRSRDYYDAPNGQPSVGPDGVYNGYLYNGATNPDAYQMYINIGNLLYPNLPTLTGNPTGSSIVRMIPPETIQYINVAVPIKRNIGDPSNGTSSGLLQQPLFSERPF
jgi:hypothetical protein